MTEQELADIAYAAKVGCNRLHACKQAERSEVGMRHTTDALCAAVAAIRKIHRITGISQPGERRRPSGGGRKARSAHGSVDDMYDDESEKNKDLRYQDGVPLICGEENTDEMKDTMLFVRRLEESQQYIDGVYNEDYKG